MPFTDGDTAVPMYATRTVPVAVLVSEQVDSFAFRADSNRHFSDTTIVGPDSREYGFAVSFHDTGWMNVSLMTYREGGAETVEQLRCRVVSPLRQDSVVGRPDASVALRTERVQDTAVWYHWRLGDGMATTLDTVSTRVWETQVNLRAVGMLPGMLWVSADEAGERFPSPAVPFWVSMDDKAGPEVLCLNGVSGDTLWTADPTFVFMVLVVDAAGVEGVRIDGEAVMPVAGSSYRRVYAGLDTLTDRKRTISVHAWDRIGNETIRTYCLVYDTNAGLTNSTHIVVTSIREDATTSRSHMMLFGSIWDPARPSVLLTASVNGTPTLDTQRVDIDTAASRGEFYYVVGLTAADNTVVLTALDTANTELADTSVRVLHRSDFIDRLSPRIVEVLVGNQIAAEGVVTYVPDTAVTVRVTAFDESGIASVSLNGRAMEAVADKPYRWQSTVDSVGYDTSYEASIRVVDSLGNAANYQFLMRRNRPPSLLSNWQWPARLFIDSSYAIEFDVVDYDGDANVTVTLVDEPEQMSVSRAEAGSGRWVIRWTPSAADSGIYVVRVMLTDSLQTAMSLWSFNVVDAQTALPRLETTPSAFPGFLQADRDTMSVTLRVVAQTGTPPFTFRLVLHDEHRQVWEMSTMDDTAVAIWAPALADTGLRHLVASASDAGGDVVELHRDLQVVPPNSCPCSLAVTHTAGICTTADGAVDMWRAGTNDTVRFRVIDDDHPLTERHEVSIVTNGKTDMRMPDSGGTFEVVLRPADRTGQDTIRVRVSDVTGTSDEVTIRSWFGTRQPSVTSGVLRFAGDGSARSVARSLVADTPSVSRWGKDSSIFRFWPNSASAPAAPSLPLHSTRCPFPSLGFERSRGSNLVADTLQGAWPWLDSAFTLFVVARLDSVAPGARYTLVSASAPNSEHIAFGVVDVECGIFTSANSAGSGGAVGSGTWHIYCFQSASGMRGSASLNAFSWLDGAAGRQMHVAERVPPGPVLLGATQLNVATNGWQGDIAELLMYSGALTNTERRLIEQFLGAKYGIVVH